MTKALITGSEGFVGKYLRAELEGHGYQVIGADIVDGPETHKIDLLDAEAVVQLVRQERPDAIFHLAAQADVGRSWREPRLTMELNVIAATNVLEAVRKVASDRTRMLMVGSSDQYGALGANGALVGEDLPLSPATPYAISKRAQEDLAFLYARSRGMWVCATRSFNHGGAGQRTGFMIPDFASGIARVERGLQEELLVGNLSSKRDFTHVRDVVRAYRFVVEKGTSGEAYNVGSGMAYSAQEVLDRLCAMATCPIPVRQDPARMRPSDTPVICCDHSKLTHDTGWEPTLSLDTILNETLEYYREQYNA